MTKYSVGVFCNTRPNPVTILGMHQQMLDGKTKSKATILWVLKIILGVEKRACIQSASSQLLYTQQKIEKQSPWPKPLTS